MPTCCIVLNVCDAQDDVDIYCFHFIGGASRAARRSSSTPRTCYPPRTADSPSVCVRRRSWHVFVPRAPVLVQVLESGQVPLFGCVPARVRVPRAPVLVQVLESGQVPICGCVRARVRVPRAPVLVQVLENGQVPMFGCGMARVRVPRAPVLVQVLESGQVSISGCATARVCTPSTVVLSRPLQQPYTPPHSSVVAYAFRSFTKKSNDSLVG